MPAFVNPNGQGGDAALQHTMPGDAEPFKAAGTITKGRCVSLSTTGTVTQSATDGTASLVVGIALQSAVSGDTLLVSTRGIAENAGAQGSIAAGDILKRSATSAGYVAATATPAAGEPIGVAFNASSSDTVDVWVSKGYGFL
jgi:hypothetical protein